MVLFVIANHCHPDGTGAFPSTTTIGAEARACRKTAERSIARLELLGELIVTRKKGSSPDPEERSRNEYVIPGVQRDGFFRLRKPRDCESPGNPEPRDIPRDKSEVSRGHECPTNNPLEQSNNLEPTASQQKQEPETKPCSKCGEIGVHNCGGYKTEKQRAKEKRQAERNQRRFAGELERPPQYRERPFTPTVGVKPQEEEGGGYRDLREIVREQEQGK